MTDLDWVAIRRIFEAARDLEPHRQQAYLTEVCAGKEAIRNEVEKLLKANLLAHDFIETPALVSNITTTAPLTLPDFIGRRIGAYEITSKLGAGGMGAVYLADRVDNVFKKKVAIKIMNPGTKVRETQRFLQERQILAELDHPNIARILDGGAIDGLPYVIMEYVPGITLRTLLNARGALALTEIIGITKQICAGLHFAHRKGIIHRDIKPENLIIQESAGFLQVKILDFGIAKLKEAEEFAVQTSTGLIFGTPRYMSPEQIQATPSQPLDARSDIYSLGMLVYEMLTGNVAFDESTWMQIAYAQVHRIPVAPSVVRPDLNIAPAVEKVVLKALEKDPSKRPQNVLVFTHELQTVIQAQTGAAELLPTALLSSPRPQAPLPLPETVAHDATTVVAQPQVIPISSLATKPMSVVQRPRKYKVVTLAFLLTALVGSGFVYYKFNPALLSQLQGNTNGIGKEPAATTRGAGKSLPLPTSEATLNYQVLVTKKTGETIPLPANNEVHSGDQVRFKPLTPFKGAVYLLYEQTPEKLVWINAVNNEAQQLGNSTGDLIPVNKPLALEDAGKTITIRLLLIFVPAGSNWSLKSAVGRSLKVRPVDDPRQQFAAHLPTEATTRLLNDLVGNAVLMPFSTVEQGQTRIVQIQLPAEQSRVIYQWVQLQQVP